jgi:hypothetical protein
VRSSYEEVAGSSADPNANLVSGTIQGFSIYAVLRALRITTDALPEALVGVSYEAPALDLSSGADGVWTVVSGSLPDGLSLSPDGVVSGVPTAAGTFPFTVQVESDGQRSHASLTLPVHNLPFAVTDLRILERSSTTLKVQFTEVDDGTGMASDYAIRRAVSPIQWAGASASEVILQGTQAGATRQVTIDIPVGVKTSHDVQMMAFRGTPGVDAVVSSLSNIATAPVLAPTGVCTESPAYAVATFAEDFYVEGSVRGHLHLGSDDPITCARAATVTEFWCCGVVIHDLAGVQNLTGLESFTVTGGLHSGSEIRDLSPLAGLRRLKTLVFDDALFYADLTPLEGLTELTTLRLRLETGLDFGPLEELHNLRTLELSSVRMTDLHPLEGLHQLTHLDLHNNPALKDIRPLLDNSGLGEGDTISLTYTSVSCADIAAVEQKGATVESNCLSVSTSALPSGQMGAQYSHQLTASAGSSPVSNNLMDWSLAAGSDPLPPGLTLSATGIISGVPPSAGTWAFTVRVADRVFPWHDEGSYSRAATKLLSITITQPPLNLDIASVLLNQGNQSPEGLVGGVANRPGLLRVILRSDRLNGASPAVRVRIFRDGALVREALLPSPRIGVPMQPNLDDLGQTWNLQLAASEVVPGLSVEALVDPDNSVPETNETDNAYPAGGGTASLDVESLPPLSVVFIPIESTVHGSLGTVNAGNTNQLLSSAWKWLPVSDFDIAIHPPMTSNHDLRTDAGWSGLLADVQALRTLEGATEEYYHAIVGQVSSPRWGGIAYLPTSPAGNSRSAVSLGSFVTSPSTVAHELGHNLGRRHAPCGGPAGPDPGYPYANAVIGFPGYDIVQGTSTPSSMFDFMSYCSPEWTSDYTFGAIREWRLADPFAAPSPLLAASRLPVDGLLIWGQIGSGGVTLNPALASQARPVMPTSPGENTLRGLAANGSELFRFTFDGESVADSEDPIAQHFAFFVPLAPEAIDQLVEIVVVTPVGSATVSSGGGPNPVGALGPVDQLALDLVGPDLVQIQWDAARYPLVVIRDRTTGEVLSFAREGTARVRATSPQDLVIVASDGTQTRALN